MINFHEKKLASDLLTTSRKTRKSLSKQKEAKKALIASLKAAKRKSESFKDKCSVMARQLSESLKAADSIQAKLNSPLSIDNDNDGMLESMIEAIDAASEAIQVYIDDALEIEIVL